MNEKFVIGKMYRAITEDEVIELDAINLPGLKLLVTPDGVRYLKVVQKKVENRTGYRPDLTAVLNALLGFTEEHYIRFSFYDVADDLKGRLFSQKRSED